MFVVFGIFLQNNLHSVFVVFDVFALFLYVWRVWCVWCVWCVWRFLVVFGVVFFFSILNVCIFSLSNYPPPLLCLMCSICVLDLFSSKIFYTLFLTCSMCFGIFPKNFWPCSHVSNVFDVFCVFGVLFCVSCVFLSSLFFLFSKIFTPRIWRVWCVSDSSTCLSWMYFVSHVFFFCCLPS